MPIGEVCWTCRGKFYVEDTEQIDDICDGDRTFLILQIPTIFMRRYRKIETDDQPTEHRTVTSSIYKLEDIMTLSQTQKLDFTSIIQRISSLSIPKRQNTGLKTNISVIFNHLFYALSGTDSGHIASITRWHIFIERWHLENN